LEYIILRPSGPYGPRQNPFRRQGVVTVFIHHALTGMPISIFGDGEITRDYFYVEDLVKALIAAKDTKFDPARTTFNLGGAQPYTLNDLIAKIQSVLGVKMSVEYEPARKFDVPSLVLDTSLAQAQLNWSPTVPLEEGIERTADWLRRQNW
jgi:UDP-glucose 4-epimerase